MKASVVKNLTDRQIQIAARDSIRARNVQTYRSNAKIGRRISLYRTDNRYSLRLEKDSEFIGVISPVDGWAIGGANIAAFCVIYRSDMVNFVSDTGLSKSWDVNSSRDGNNIKLDGIVVATIEAI